MLYRTQLHAVLMRLTSQVLPRCQPNVMPPASSGWHEHGEQTHFLACPCSAFPFCFSVSWSPLLSMLCSFLFFCLGSPLVLLQGWPVTSAHSFHLRDLAAFAWTSQYVGPTRAVAANRSFGERLWHELNDTGCIPAVSCSTFTPHGKLVVDRAGFRFGCLFHSSCTTMRGQHHPDVVKRTFFSPIPGYVYFAFLLFLFVCSFVRLFVCSFVRSFVCLLDCFLPRSLARLLACLLCLIVCLFV